jgi:NAD(P)-dependent dehydrogenase (short-subunit alcohol dehydrogenase family)
MITRALAVNGASKVYIVGRRREVLEAAAQEINPEVVVPLPGDVTCRETLLHLADNVKTATGYVNLVVANAGIMGPRPLKDTPDGPPPSVSEYRAHALRTPMEEFTKTYAVNTTAVYYTALAFLDLLDQGNKRANMGPDWCSQILATSSIGGFSRLRGASFAYNSSKAAVTHLMMMLATSFVPFKIRCNVLAPGPFPSDMTTGIFGNTTSFEKISPAGRAGKEEDIAGAVLYLATKAGAYLNGSVLVVDGGRLGTLVSTH